MGQGGSLPIPLEFNINDRLAVGVIIAGANRKFTIDILVEEN